jgi:hypothetical protein
MTAGGMCVGGYRWGRWYMWMVLWGQEGIAGKKTFKTDNLTVDGQRRMSMGFCIGLFLTVDRVLIGRHESNPPSNNYYKENYKILWKKVLVTAAWG